MEAVNDEYFVCVECGMKAKSLYKKFPRGIFDLNKCVSICFYFRRIYLWKVIFKSRRYHTGCCLLVNTRYLNAFPAENARIFENLTVLNGA